LVQKQAKKHLAALQTSRDQEVQDLQDELARLKAAQLEDYQEPQENAPFANEHEETPTIARPRPQDTLEPETPFQVPPSPAFDNPRHLQVKADHYKKLTEHHQPRDTDYNYRNINSNINTRVNDYYKAYDPWEFSSPRGHYKARQPRNFHDTEYSYAQTTNWRPRGHNPKKALTGDIIDDYGPWKYAVQLKLNTDAPLYPMMKQRLDMP
jgi:hypothetical protein